MFRELNWFLTLLLHPYLYPSQAYNDVATRSIADRTGGLDGSIFFSKSIELRLVVIFRFVFLLLMDFSVVFQNVGGGMHNTLRYLRFLDNYISSQWILDIRYFELAQTHIHQALTSWPSVPCGELLLVRALPFLTKVDAEPRLAPDHLPEPSQDLATHTEKFQLKWFSPTEMIVLVACGHTIGSVCCADFRTSCDRTTQIRVESVFLFLTRREIMIVQCKFDLNFTNVDGSNFSLL